jgi:hypothetical protein
LTDIQDLGREFKIKSLPKQKSKKKTNEILKEGGKYPAQISHIPNKRREKRKRQFLPDEI